MTVCSNNGLGSDPDVRPDGRRLIFDGDCGFCTKSAQWIGARLPCDIDITPWQALNLDEFGLSERQVMAAAWWIDDAGNAHRGHKAVGRSLIAAGGAWALLGRSFLIAPGSWLARPGYALIARFRYKLPGSSDACRLPK